jgi:putative ABC transport system ATP-binding protein
MTPTTTTSTTAAALSLRGIHHTYGTTEVLHGIDLQLAPGALAALVGPSGSGKTTLLAIAGGLLRPTSGDVLLTGDELYPRDRTDLRVARRAAFILQASSTIGFLTVEDNLFKRLIVTGRRVGSAERERARRLLAAVGLGDKAGRFPSSLSGGERQRVCVAEALFTGAPVILADEPTAALDRARGREVMELLAEHAHATHAGVIVSTHDERCLDLADRIITIEDGRLIAASNTAR